MRRENDTFIDYSDTLIHVLIVQQSRRPGAGFEFSESIDVNSMDMAL